MNSAFKRNSLTFAVLAAVLATAPMVHAAGSYVRNSAFEELSGTHASTTLAQPSERLNTGFVRNTAFESYNAYEELSGTHASTTAAQPLKTGFVRNTAFENYDAFEELSGTHAGVKPKARGMAGKPGEKGEPGSAGAKQDADPTQ
jgi:hypothetical protein